MYLHICGTSYGTPYVDVTLHAGTVM